MPIIPFSDLLLTILPVVAFFIFAGWVITTGNPQAVRPPTERERSSGKPVEK